MNLGLIRSTATREYLGIAPLFDNGRCFFFDAQKPDELATGLFFHTSHPFSEYPTAQLAMVTDYSWFDADALEGFGDELAGIIAQNELAPSWYPEGVASQFARQLERVVESAHERGW